jgi:hypothetical protein
MKTNWTLLTVAGLCAISSGLWISEASHARESRNSELFFLMNAKIEVENRLNEGRNVPTNWFDLTNSLRWQSLVKYSSNSGKSSFAENYTVLSHAVICTFYNRTSAVFLVRLKPCSWPSRPQGRWVLSATDTQVYKTWMDEDQLPPALKSEIPNSSK